MRTGEHYFIGTPLEQNTWELHCPDTKAEYKGPYTQFWISAWNYEGSMQKIFDERSMFIHEFCHIIHMYGKEPDRLLQRNYGFEFGKLTRAGLSTEMMVLAIQQKLTLDIFGFDPLTEEILQEIHREFSNPSRGVKMEYSEFRILFFLAVSFISQHSTAQLVSQFHYAAKHVADNREPDLVFDLLGI